MADDSDSRGWSIPWPVLMTLVAAVGGALCYFRPLISSRPSGELGESPVALGYQDAPARLWQDPFKAAREQMAALTKAGNSPDDQIALRIESDQARGSGGLKLERGPT